MNEKLQKIINHYGIDKQLKYFQSEVFELNEAIIEREIHWNYDTEIQNIKSYDRHIAEEIADVMVMLKQIQLYYDISTEDIEEIMTFKVNRQLERIEKEKENENE